ncbi:hypothetical protein ACHAXA_003507 [Cyclostephanos tholiformis]|uniref:GYF domain-containing protein n=1 Tax=Cyclostephanos tholiformis TaxID=382380 RepID=A0ABD3SG09_9STRA
MSSGPSHRGGRGGILRSRKRDNTGEEDGGGAIGRGVTFSTNVETGFVEFSKSRPPSSINDGGGGNGGGRSPFAGIGDNDDNEDDDDYEDDDDDGRGSGRGGGVDYDSDDDTEDAILASGDDFSSAVVVGSASSIRKNKWRNLGDDDDDETAAFRNPAEIEEARRKRGLVRRGGGRIDGIDESAIAKIDHDDNSARNRIDRRRNDQLDDVNDDDNGFGDGLSLITDKSADPDAYEWNASGNASCPVEPFNMDAERDGGMGYFDGDTYVFRRNKPIDGEEDAWLDGTLADGDNVGDGGGGSAGGGLDSTSVWRPTLKATTTDNDVGRGKSKFVADDETPEDLGRRLVNLLSDDNETAMMALARHGAFVRELRARELKATKIKSRFVNRKRHGGKISSVSLKHHGNDGEKTDDSTADDATADAMRRLKAETQRTREMVEELTELADALLFGGETEAYELTRMDWIHRYKLDEVRPSKLSAVDSGMTQDSRVSKKRKSYFDDATSIDEGGNSEPPPPLHQTDEVMWEYKGNEDGVIHGPYTSRQMLDWTSCGYFVGESSVDIRRVSERNAVGVVSTAKNGAIDGNHAEDDIKADVDDLMADLLDDDDGDNAGTMKKESCDTDAETKAESSWSRSDRRYLRFARENNLALHFLVL